MIVTKLFRRHFLISAGILILFVILGLAASDYMMRLNFEQNRAHFMPMIGVILDEHGQVLYPKDGKISFDWQKVTKPEKPFDQVALDIEGPPLSLVRLPGEPTRYMVDLIRPPGPPGAPPPGFPPRPLGLRGPGHGLPTFLVFAFGFLIFAVLSGSALGLYLLFRQVNSIEQTRMGLLQELAHDLRTPVASLKNLLEMLQLKRQSLSPEIQNEFLALSLKEVEYFERLVEDLLLLAKVSEPKKLVAKEKVNLGQIVTDEAEALASQPFGGKTVRLIKSVSAVEIAADPHLLRRLVRNALHNAFSYARDEVKVSLEVSGRQAWLTVEDDGKGLSLEALKIFGERRKTRVIEQSESGRLSVGLGSVIMKTIADSYGGSLKIENRVQQNEVAGARLEIVLPLS
jgi:hypothetical protein